MAPLCHLAIHAYDIRGPLGINTPIDPATAELVLDEITQGKHAVPSTRYDGLRLEAVDSDWSISQGLNARGPVGGVDECLERSREGCQPDSR